MQTTGTVLLNARGVNINGYDCFVNLSKDMKKYPTTCGFGQWDGVTPLSGYQIWNGVTNSSTKFSPVSFSFSNYFQASISFTTNDLTSIPTTFTTSTWQKGVVLDESQAQNNDIRKYHYRSRGFEAFCNMFTLYNNARKHTEVLKSDNTWVNQTHNVNFANDNWHHYALTKSGNRIMVFIDGIKVFDKSDSWYSRGYYLRLVGACQTMYADDLVVIAGQALWTSDFTPPSTYLLDSEYAMDLDQVKRRNIILSNVDKKLIIPDEETLKQY